MISLLFMSFAFAEPDEQEETAPSPQEESAPEKETESSDTPKEKEPEASNDESTETSPNTEESPPAEEVQPTQEEPAAEENKETVRSGPSTEKETRSPESEERPPAEEETSNPSIDLSNAQELENLKRKQLMWLKPLPERFEQNPYLHVDFTSYTLEWGEVQVGLNTLKAGILPRTQIGTSIPMWAVGLQNVDAKVNLLRFGAFDLALEGNSISLPTPDFRMSLTGGGLSTSVRILEPWTVHLGTQYMAFSAQGLPDLDSINPLILQMSGVDADNYRDELAADGVGFDINADVITVRMATDIRLNRRDSWIIQAQGIVWHNIDSSSNFNDSDDIPKFLNADEIFALQSQGVSDITKSYVVSVAHQWSWNHSYLRIGAGWSSMTEYAFAPAIIQSIDYAWRFGGKSKNREGRIRKGWKENKKKLEQDPSSKKPSGQ